MAALQDALAQYSASTGDYPTTAQGLGCLTRPTSRGHPPFLPRIPLDPWGHAYIYRYDPEGDGRYRLLSAGPDGKEGTMDDIVWVF